MSTEDKLRRYEKIDFLGEGQFATVFKALDKETGQIVAVKKIKMGSRAEAEDGINRTALREIKLLQELHHPNVISLMDVFGHKSNVSLVFDFMDTDLEIIIKDTELVLRPSDVKAYTLMTLKGLEYLHMNWILHRDLKPNNLLVTSAGVLKLGDFGLAKYYGSPNRIYTHQVVTRWYRAPELLFGAQMYGAGVDVWAVGCIMAELLLRIPFLAGDSDLDQLTKIFTALGTPTDETWKDVSSLGSFVKFKHFPGTPLQNIFTAASDSLLEVLAQMMTLDPSKRGSCSSLLQMSYFSTRPHPTHGPQLPLPADISARKKELDRPSVKRRIVESAEESGMGSLAKKLIF